MKSMKLKKSDTPMDVEVAGDSNGYPYGLRISLSKDEMDKLGLSADMDIDKGVMIHAKAFVASTSQYKDGSSEGGNIELQITDMEVEMPTADRAGKMYPDMET